MTTRTYIRDMIKKMTAEFDAARNREEESYKQMMSGSYNYSMRARTIF